MPLDSLLEGVDLSWTTFAEFLDYIDGEVAVNAGFLVGHSTVRRLVLGEDWQRAASDDEIDAMGRLVSQSLENGALGFSSSWSDTHNDAAGDPVPSRYATEEELLRLCEQLRGHPGTWLEFLPWATGPFPDDRARLMGRMSAIAGGKPLNWNLLTVNPTISDELVQNRLGASDVAKDVGGSVFGLTLPVSTDIRINLDSGFLFDVEPTWGRMLNSSRRAKCASSTMPSCERRSWTKRWDRRAPRTTRSNCSSITSWLPRMQT